MPWKNVEAALRGLPEWNGRVVIDATNPFAETAAAGLRTASVARPDEFGPGTGATVPKTPVDIAANSLNELADKLGA